MIDNKKKELEKKNAIQGMLKDTLILLIITLVSGLVLGFVYNLTKEPIEFQKSRKIQNTCARVYESADSFQETVVVPSSSTKYKLEENGYNGVEFGTVYNAYNHENCLLGYVLTVTTHDGYAGDITFMMGINNEGMITGVSILNTKETPGLGRNAENKLVPQFKEKQVSSFEVTKHGAEKENQVDALTGATITTNAVTNGVNAGLIFYREDLNQGGDEF